MSRELVTIRRNLPIELDLPSLTLCEPDRKAAFALFSELEFKSLMQEFVDEEKRPPLKGNWLSDSEAENFFRTMSAQSMLFVGLGNNTGGALGRKRAETGCVQGDFGNAVLVDLKSEAQALQWRRLSGRDSRV
jgi:hypothetical protein